MSKLTCEITNHENLPIHCFTDSRSLFEASGTSSLVSDRRLHVEIGAIQQMVSKSEISLKWIEKRKQLSDVLTKKGASPNFLMDTVSSGNISWLLH